MSCDAMMQRSADSFGPWIAAARGGDAESLGLVLEACRAYLTLVAGQVLPPDLTRKVGASDLVQETFLAARRDFADFHGKDQDALLRWLGQILRNRAATTGKAFRGTRMRDIGREVPIHARDESTLNDLTMPNPLSTPSQAAMRSEREVALNDALRKLPVHYRQVVVWYHMEKRSHEEIADRLGKSVDAVRKLWARALERLEQALGPDHDPR